MIGVKLATAALLGLAVSAALAQAPSIEETRRAESDTAGDARTGFEPGAPRSMRSGDIAASALDNLVGAAGACPSTRIPARGAPCVGGRSYQRSAGGAGAG